MEIYNESAFDLLSTMPETDVSDREFFTYCFPIPPPVTFSLKLPVTTAWPCLKSAYSGFTSFDCLSGGMSPQGNIILPHICFAVSPLLFVPHSSNGLTVLSRCFLSWQNVTAKCGSVPTIYSVKLCIAINYVNYVRASALSRHHKLPQATVWVSIGKKIKIVCTVYHFWSFFLMLWQSQNISGLIFSFVRPHS